ncbi:helix-turn-helix transcriptional regulator [Ramlibacter ginsenosidimutans]|uniref:Helix-turn-helix transcriptional regulator n=1 Tax=Ramlibacter ginsenosidimutans TaxID=502333 RepID=A0A934WKN1_9BURK|nr:helix-turn-helix transcriptional regulator [Ramlibacter ginsenosidimutans]MBK6004790.1 helix-turn-helix transcriptional regulator [Ramlibacter ginsenosidimutans]
MLQFPGSERAREVIELLVPDETAAISIVYRTEAGLARRAFVRAPLVSVVPPGQHCSMHCAHRGDTLVLRLAPHFYADRVRAALGEVSLPAGRFAVFDPFVRAITNGLLDELRGGRRPAAAYLEPLGAVLAVHLARHYGAAAPEPNSGRCGLPPHRLVRVQAFVRDNISEELHVERLAAEVHMSQYHFARMFKHATGLPPHLYIVMQRVSHAKALLQDTELPLLEVAEQSGFRTQGHFTGVFGRYAGMTPRTFRVACRAALPGVRVA